VEDFPEEAPSGFVDWEVTGGALEFSLERDLPVVPNTDQRGLEHRSSKMLVQVRVNDVLVPDHCNEAGEAHQNANEASGPWNSSRIKMLKGPAGRPNLQFT